MVFKLIHCYYVLFVYLIHRNKSSSPRYTLLMTFPSTWTEGKLRTHLRTIKALECSVERLSKASAKLEASSSEEIVAILREEQRLGRSVQLSSEKDKYYLT